MPSRKQVEVPELDHDAMMEAKDAFDAEDYL